MRLTGRVTGLAAHPKRLLEVANGLLIAALPQVDEAEVRSASLSGPVADFTEQR